VKEHASVPVIGKRSWLIMPFILLGIVFLVFTLLDLVAGPVKIPMDQLLNTLLSGHHNNSQWNQIIFEFRLPRTATAILAGMALAVSGLQMQTVFRNPLAGPYVLGISSGAGLGVAILVLGIWPIFSNGLGNIPGSWAVFFAAALGSAAVLVLILAVSIRISDIMTILILGMLFGSAISALVSILQYFSNEYSLKTYVLWTMGSLGGVSTSQLKVMGPAVLGGLILSIFSGKLLNALLLGENYALTLGVNIRLARTMVFLSTSILAGSITAFCGPIGFVGIAVPHLARMIFQTASHHILIPASMLGGAILMLISDIICQLPGTSFVLPINSITALLGIPIVIWIVTRNIRLTSLSS
jgi:iron complex transport system permease protein